MEWLIGAVVAGMLALIATGVSSAVNSSNVDETNQTNKDIAEATNLSNEKMANKANELNDAHFQQEFEWNKYVQEQTWAREDTQYQRRVQDLQNAGISPLALANTSYSAGQTVSAPQANPAVFAQAQAPQFMAHQFDASSLISGLFSTGDTITRYLENKETNQTKKDISHAELSSAELINLRTLNATSENISKQIQSAEKIAGRTDSTQRLQILKNFELGTKQLAEMETNHIKLAKLQDEKQQAEAYNKSVSNFLESMKQQYGTGVRWKVYDDDSEFESAWSKFCDDFINFQQELLDAGPTSFSENNGEANQEQHSWQAGADVKSNAKLQNLLGGFGAEAAKNDSKYTSQTKGSSQDWSKYQEQLIKRFWTTHEVPVSHKSYQAYFYNGE